MAGETPVLELRVATNFGRGDDRKTVWIRVSLWGNYGKAMAPHLHKGDKIVVHGEMTDLHVYDGKNGPTPSVDVKAHSVITMSPGSNGNSGDGNSSGGRNQNGGRNQSYSNGGNGGGNWGNGGNGGSSNQGGW
jgi:single-strand DNA-binding protein